MIASFKSWNDSSVERFADTLTRTTRWGRYHEMKEHMPAKIAEIVERHGAGSSPVASPPER